MVVLSSLGVTIARTFSVRYTRSAAWLCALELVRLKLANRHCFVYDIWFIEELVFIKKKKTYTLTESDTIKSFASRAIWLRLTFYDDEYDGWLASQLN